MTKALLVIDIQADFCPGGSLAVEGGDELAANVTNYIKTNRFDYEVIALTRDWHIEPGEHFASNINTEPNYTTTWPDHCMAGYPGADFHPNFIVPPESIIFSKGQYAAAYSGFEGSMYDVGKQEEIKLQEFLILNNVDTIDVVGIATDYCVKATVLDGLRLGFKVNVFGEMIKAVDKEETGPAAIVEMVKAGANFI